jgi:hypothetical protein
MASFTNLKRKLQLDLIKVWDWFLIFDFRCSVPKMLLDFEQTNKGNYHIKTLQIIRSVCNEFDIITVNSEDMWFILV